MSPAACSEKLTSSGAAVFVDQTAQHVDPLHRRVDSARLDQHQPGG